MTKVFQILVPDNTLVSRIISCENQVTELFVIDRADKKFVAEHSAELNKPALYILVNRDKRKLYVGETDDSIKRLKNHEAKDFWTEAIVFHSTTETLSTTEVRWLEAKTYEALKELGYYDLSENKVAPQQPPPKETKKYISLLPVYSLRAACGYFGDGEDVEELGWMHVEGMGRLNKDMFVVQAVGQSMEPRIHNGDYCVFEKYSGGSRQGKIVLAQHRGYFDEDNAGAYSIKEYSSEKSYNDDGSWQHESITLRPFNPAYEPIRIDAEDAESFAIIGEFVGVVTL